MRTVYGACLSRLGLSLARAAELHGVRRDTVNSWSSGRNPVPAGAWGDLRAYEAQIIDTSEAMREAWKQAGAPQIEINDSDAGGTELLAAADFVLSTDAPVVVDRTAATQMARQARRPN